MAHKITLIPGDGIGPEVTHAVVRILEATGVKFEWERYAAGAEAFEIHGEYIPAALYEIVSRSRGPSPRPSAAASRASTSHCARSLTSSPTSVPSRICPASPPTGRVSTSSSSAKTLRANT